MCAAIRASFILLICSSLYAQEVTGSNFGSVTDSTGGAVPGAKIAVTATEQHRVVVTVSTGSRGEFAATLLPIGTYSLTVDARGFKRLVRQGIELHVSEKLTIPLVLEVGQVNQQVTVEANPMQVELQSAAAAGLISGAEIRELSINNRNYIALLQLMPGVVNTAATDELSIGGTDPLGKQNSIPFSINGGRTSANNFMLDGADNVDRGSNLSLLNTPSVDAIAEFKVIRGVYSAEFGRGSAGQVNVITKSGGSQFHGNAYEFFRNDQLSGNDFLNNAHRIARPPLRYNDFGYTFGGPVFIPGKYNQDKNKTFFFWSQEFRRVITYSTFQSLVPSAAMKQGTFSSPVCVEYNGTACQQTATQITAINPVAAAYIKDLWSKIPSGNPANFTLFSPRRNIYNFGQELIKIDHTFSPKLSISGRFMSDAINTQEPGGYMIGNALPGVATTSTHSPDKNWVVRAVSTFSPALVNEAGFNYSDGARFSVPIGFDGSAASSDVQVSLPFHVSLDRIPNLSITGGNNTQGFGPYFEYNQNYNFYDNVTKVLGPHTVKFGVTVNYYRKSENSATNNAGTFAFSTTPPAGTPSIQQNWADFLLGNVTTFTQASLDLAPDMRQRQVEAYVQDDWRAASNFTLNAGVRYSNFRQPYDDNHYLTSFNPALFDPAKAPQVNPSNGNIVPNTGDALNGIIVNGSSSPYGAQVANNPGGKFAPRLGFAWDPFKTGKTSIRSGFGLSYDSSLVGMFENNIFANPPFVDNITITNTRLENPAAGIDVISAAPKTLRATPIPALLPYTSQWSFDIQRQLAPQFMIDVGYYGSKSTHLLGIVDLNEVPAGEAVAAGITTAAQPLTASTTPRLNAIRPYRGYAAINSVENWFNSNYNSLQVSAERRFGGNSTLRLAYTWSKTLTDESADRSGEVQNTYDRAADYGLATFNRAQVLTVSYIYQVPFRSHSHFANAVLHGWELSGITTFASGLPLAVNSSGLGRDWGDIGVLANTVTPRPDLVCNPDSGAPHSIAQWFNTQCYAPVPSGDVRPGNAGVTTATGPGYQQWNVSLFRNLDFGERIHLQIRGETFNIVNHANPSVIASSLGATNFGQVTAMREPRRIQLGLKLSF
ncbi:MAG: carboxypeptidase regulatory-like domain-containing protein [Bryobacteraceae bacterium]